MAISTIEKWPEFKPGSAKANILQHLQDMLDDVAHGKATYASRMKFLDELQRRSDKSVAQNPEKLRAACACVLNTVENLNRSVSLHPKVRVHNYGQFAA